MKFSLLPWFVAVAIFAASAGWLSGRRSAIPAGAGAASGARGIAFYQDSMHPWIKSDKPGKCTICGMDLTPVREGEAGFAAAEGVIALSPTNVQIAAVRTEPVRRQTVRRTLHFNGTISYVDKRRVFVSARLNGEVEKVNSERLVGNVAAGTVLATITGKELSALQREFLTLHHEGAAKFPGGEVERNQRLNLARARLKELGLSDAQVDALPARPSLETRMEVRAPAGGTVTARWIYDGMGVTEGQRLFEIVDRSRVWFRFDTYLDDTSWMAPNLEVEITTPSAPGQSFRGTIDSLEPATGETVAGLKGRAELPNPPVIEGGVERYLLRDRDRAHGTVQVEAPDVLAVPRSAVLAPAGRPLVYVEQSAGAYEARAVTLGRTGDALVEVLGGLREGERVVTMGNLLIDAQAQITQSSPPAAPAPEKPAAVEPELTPLNELQERKTNEIIGLAVSVGSALARDSLQQYNQQLPALGAVIPDFLAAFAADAAARPLLAALEPHASLRPAADLAAARKDFLGFSNALAAFAKALRRQPSFAFVRVFHCPMVNAAVPGAGKDGFWVQSTAALQNPFFGAEMLECGVEVPAPPPAGKAAAPPEAPTQPAPVRTILPAAPAKPEPPRYP